MTNRAETFRLENGQMSIYQFGEITLHTYLTKDPMNNTVFVFEKAGRAVVLEQPNFTYSIKELEVYLSDMGIDVAGVVPSYHMAGVFLPTVARYSTREAYDFATHGHGKQMVHEFAAAFGAQFDDSILPITDFIEPGEVTIGGITFNIIRANYAFDVEIPEANLMYTHMLGHDSHSIVFSLSQAEDTISQLKSFGDANYAMILSSHHSPETLADVSTKIGYLRTLISLACVAKTSDAFVRLMQATFPYHANENYLNMTAANLQHTFK